MMKCINFDRAFERYMAEWMKENSEKYKDDMDVIEDMMRRECRCRIFCWSG